jgi:hypothetical protein
MAVLERGQYLFKQQRWNLHSCRVLAHYTTLLAYITLHQLQQLQLIQESVLHATTTEHNVGIVTRNFQSSNKHIWLVLRMLLPLLFPNSFLHHTYCDLWTCHSTVIVTHKP